MSPSLFPPFSLSSSLFVGEVRKGERPVRKIERGEGGGVSLTLSQDDGEYEVKETGMRMSEKQVDRFFLFCFVLFCFI